MAKIKATIKKDSPAADIIKAAKAEKQAFKETVESGNSKQQTAVMALAKAFREWQKEWDRFDKEKTKQPKSFDEFIQPFLEMEKERMNDCWRFGRGSYIDKEPETFEQYYKETFGSSTPELRYKDGTPMRKYNSPKLQAIEMENKQTAVEWLIEQIKKDSNIRLRGLDLDELEEQAKQMEKEQIMNAYIDGELQQGFEAEAEQYYNETYNK